MENKVGELTSALQEEENAAMLLDKQAVLKVVNGLRRYRKAAYALLATRYRDGAVDGAMVHRFESEIEDTENLLTFSDELTSSDP